MKIRTNPKIDFLSMVFILSQLAEDHNRQGEMDDILKCV